jgi:hypothetical protein
MNTLRFNQCCIAGAFTGVLLILNSQSARADALAPTSQAIPSAVETSAEHLQGAPLTVDAMPTLPEAVETAPVAQAVTPGRATRSGSSYVGAGGNIGFGGRTALGRGSFTIFSKVGLTNNLSARPAVNIGRRPAILLPVTVDFPLRSAADGQASVAPYVGGGAVISTGRDSVVRGLVTGGVDVPLSNQLTANAGVNVGFLGKTEVGLRLGVGYNF